MPVVLRVGQISLAAVLTLSRSMVGHDNVSVPGSVLVPVAVSESVIERSSEKDGVEVDDTAIVPLRVLLTVVE